MSTVTQVADRTYRTWLHGPDDQPVIVTLAANVSSSVTTITYGDTTLAPDEEDVLAPGVIIEFADGEQCRITAVDDVADSLTVIRGVNGTTAAAHTAADEILVAPKYARLGVIEAVKDNVVALYPSLWQRATETVTTQEAYVEVPATVVNPVKFTWLNGTRYQSGVVDLLTNFTPSSTGKAIQFYNIPSGKTGYLVYEGSFARPSTAATELSTLGVAAEWERIVAVGAAAQVISGQPPDALTAEYITEQLEREALPPGAATDIRNGLLTMRSVWIEEAHRALRAVNAPAVVYNTGAALR